MKKFKPCPFCGNTEDFSYRFKKDKRKVNGIYYKICTIKCNKCTASIQQAGATDIKAEQNALEIWNRRAEQTEPNYSEKPNNCEEPQIFICPIQDDYEALIEDEPQTGRNE